MAAVKARITTEDRKLIAGRVRKVRVWLGSNAVPPRKRITQRELHALVVAKYGDRAPSLRTVRRAEAGYLTRDFEDQLAVVGRFDPGWALNGHGRPPGMASVAPEEPAGETSGFGAPPAPLGMLSPQERQMRAEVVAQHWQRVIREHEIPWQDLLGLLWAEADWLERHHHSEAAEDSRRTIAELIRRFGGGRES